MKKTLLLILICVLLLSFISCGKSADENNSKDNLTESADSATKESNNTSSSDLDSTSSANSDLSTTSSSQKNVETFISRLINASDGTEVESLTVMKASDAPSDDFYNVYAIITYDRKHTPSDSQQIIKDYSDSYASSVDTKLGDVENLSIVWLVSNLNGTSSITYEKMDGMLSLKEETYDKKFGITVEGTTNSAIQASTGSAVNSSVSESVVKN